MARESASEALVRWKKLHLLQDYYSEFIPFLHDVMALLGFHVSEIQEDIAKFIAYGPHYLMVKAQRGQAKTTIAAAYAVWCLIHNPSFRVLIVSAGGSQASDISTLIIRIIMSMDELECMRPDLRNGDRSSVEHFDVHYTLKGVDKSPSVKCLGITANLQGNRADLLLADDVESAKNSATAVMRAQLLHLTLDFTSICSTGRIIWLGTPQSEESIYMTLPGRGVTVRVWPGRYPTQAQLENYGDELAPLLLRRMQADPSLMYGGGISGDQGKPIEKEGTGWLDEANLQQKELDQGESWFQLQHMLNTKLADAMRFPIKLDRCVVLDVADKAPITIERNPDPAACQDFHVHGFGFKLRRALSLSPEQVSLNQIVAYVDPAGGGVNADETAYAVTAFLNGNVILLDIGGVPGGYDKNIMVALAERLAKFKPNAVVIEKNMGFGAFREVFVPVLHSKHKCAVEDDMVTGQKEKRIIATLEPVIGRGALIVSTGAIEQDKADCARYSPKDRQCYSLFFQLAKLTKERGALVHDDRADALEGAVRYWQKYLAVDQERLAQQERERAMAELTKDPMGRHRFDPPAKGGRSLFSKYRR
jgi:hypothetical protein